MISRDWEMRSRLLFFRFGDFDMGGTDFAGVWVWGFRLRVLGSGGLGHLEVLWTFCTSANGVASFGSRQQHEWPAYLICLGGGQMLTEGECFAHPSSDDSQQCFKCTPGPHPSCRVLSALQWIQTFSSAQRTVRTGSVKAGGVM